GPPTTAGAGRSGSQPGGTWTRNERDLPSTSSLRTWSPGSSGSAPSKVVSKRGRRFMSLLLRNCSILIGLLILLAISYIFAHAAAGLARPARFTPPPFVAGTDACPGY